MGKITDTKGHGLIQQLAVNRKNRTMALVKSYTIKPDGSLSAGFTAKSRSDLRYDSIEPDSSFELLYNSIWPNKADMSSNRWYYLGNWGNSGSTFFVDNATVRKDANTAIVWVKIVNPNGDRTVWQCLLKRKDETIKVLYSNFIQANGYSDYEGGWQRSESVWSNPMYEKLYYALWYN